MPEWGAGRVHSPSKSTIRSDGSARGLRTKAKHSREECYGNPGLRGVLQYNLGMIDGHATAEGTSTYAARFPEALGNGFYRDANHWKVSSLGLGSYLGGLDEETDIAYFASVIDAFRGGINFFDAAINYRHQRSERAIGAAFRLLLRDGDAKREEFVVCTKAGFLTPGAIPETGMVEEEIVRGTHCMLPDFLKDQVQRSRENFGLSSLDVYYLHNPETQLASVERPEFLRRVRRAFEAMEWCVEQGWIRAYGTATWDGFRRRDPADPGLQLTELVEIAKDVAGDEHHFRFIQVPFNLGMVEAFAVQNQQGKGGLRSILGAAAENGLHVVTSASILQSRLSRDLPEQTKLIFPDAETDAQRAIQFARSAPQVVSALVGMSKQKHVAENLGLTRFAPMPSELFQKLF